MTDKPTKKRTPAQSADAEDMARIMPQLTDDALIELATTGKNPLLSEAAEGDVAGVPVEQRPSPGTKGPA